MTEDFEGFFNCLTSIGPFNHDADEGTDKKQCSFVLMHRGTKFGMWFLMEGFGKCEEIVFL